LSFRSPAEKKRARPPKAAIATVTGDKGAPKSADDERPAGPREPQKASMQAKALEVIRASHYGVTSDEIHRAVGCATIQSAYQIAMELRDKGLVEKTPAGAWKALAAANG
jgi:hypothetical protein